MNVSIYFEDGLLRSIDEERRRLGISRSELIQRTVEEYFTRARQPLPPEFLALMGAWEDTRTPDEILSAVATVP